MSIKFGDAEVRDFPEGRFLLVPVMFEAKKGNGPVVGLTVQFFVNSDAVDTVFTTSGSGHIFFDAHGDPQAKRLLIIAIVKDGDREVGVISEEWRKKEEPKPDLTCKVIRATRLPKNADGYTSFRVLASTGDEKTVVDEEFTIDSTEVLEIRWRGVAHTGNLVTEHGHTVVQIRTKEPNRAASLIFRSVKNPAVASDPQQLEAWEQPKAKKCKKVKATVAHGRPGFQNTLSIESLAETADDAAKLSAKLSIEYPDDILVEIEGNEQRGRRVEFETDGSGCRMVKIVFIQPAHYGNIKIVSVDDRSVYTSIYVRHPQSAARP